jgi:hypothetical protein
MLALGPATTGAQSTLRGRVIDGRGAFPLADVSVVITSGRDTLARTRSDSSGQFEASLANAAPVVAHFMRLGYQADSISATGGGETPLRVAMMPLRSASNILSTVVIRDTARSAFDRRARRNAGGVFMRLEDIEKQKPLRTSDLFRSLPGVSVGADSNGVMQIVSLRAQRPTAPSPRQMPVGNEIIVAPSRDTRRCAIRIGVDGRLMPPDFSMDDLRPSDIVAIEAYLGAATMPIEFSSVQRDAPCGIVMFWIKNGSERR